MDNKVIEELESQKKNRILLQRQLEESAKEVRRHLQSPLPVNVFLYSLRLSQGTRKNWNMMQHEIRRS